MRDEYDIRTHGSASPPASCCSRWSAIDFWGGKRISIGVFHARLVPIVHWLLYWYCSWIAVYILRILPTCSCSTGIIPTRLTWALRFLVPGWWRTALVLVFTFIMIVWGLVPHGTLSWFRVMLRIWFIGRDSSLGIWGDGWWLFWGFKTGCFPWGV